MLLIDQGLGKHYYSILIYSTGPFIRLPTYETCPVLRPIYACTHFWRETASNTKTYGIHIVIHTTLHDSRRSQTRIGPYLIMNFELFGEHQIMEAMQFVFRNTVYMPTYKPGSKILADLCSILFTLCFSFFAFFVLDDKQQSFFLKRALPSFVLVGSCSIWFHSCW